MMKYFFSSLIILFFSCTTAYAVNLNEQLKDPQLEQRARTLSLELRCLVCQNQSIDDSDAQLAHDLRVILREQIAAGKSDQEILAFMKERYGDFILLRPQFNEKTLFLWLMPFLVLLLGFFIAIRAFLKSKQQISS